MSMVHNFNVEAAKEVGVNAALLLQSISFWCEKNRANGKSYHDGLHWTYNSTKAWQEIYPYLGTSAINSALKKLEERGYIKTGNYNKSAYDRTKWYAITDEGLSLLGESIFENREMEEAENQNPSGENAEPIPVAYTVASPVSSTDTQGGNGRKSKNRFSPPSIEEVRQYVSEKGYHFDPDAFYAYYASQDWKKGNGQRVSNWRQCCVTWELKREEKSKPKNVLPESERLTDLDWIYDLS